MRYYMTSTKYAMPECFWVEKPHAQGVCNLLKERLCYKRKRGASQLSKGRHLTQQSTLHGRLQEVAWRPHKPCWRLRTLQ